MRQTSIDCYNQIKEEGLLSKMRLEVYESLLAIGKPSTTQEIFLRLNHKRLEQARLSELRELGVIYEKQTRRCTVSGRTAIEWDLTDNLPQKRISKDKNTPRNLNRVIDFIQKKMKTKGMMWIDENDLNNLKTLKM